MRTYPDPFFRRWSRRALTYTLVFAGFILMVATLPVWLPAALIADAFRRVHLSTTRAICFVTLYLFFQVWGLIVLFGIWLIYGRNYDRYMDKMFWIEFTWGYYLGYAGIRLFGMTIHLEDEYEWGTRPAIVLVRHASITDTFVPLVFACALHKQRLRYVMKRELEWDPCLDLAVNRMPHLFVVRGSTDSDKEVEAIGKLMDGVQANEGVIIFPEGTRYTPSKRARILKKLAELGQTDVLDWATRYRHVLPPRTAGPLALFRRATELNADIVFCAHTGLERSSSFKDSFNGSLVGTHVHIRFRAVPASALPEGDEARKTWLFEQWMKVDEYIEAHQAGLHSQKKKEPISV